MTNEAFMKPKIYIETSIPSFYYEIRTEATMIARREWTRDWWDNLSKNYDVFTSLAVINELDKGDFPNKEKAIEFIKKINYLNINAMLGLYVPLLVTPLELIGD